MNVIKVSCYGSSLRFRGEKLSSPNEHRKKNSIYNFLFFQIRRSVSTLWLLWLRAALVDCVGLLLRESFVSSSRFNGPFVRQEIIETGSILEGIMAALQGETWVKVICQDGDNRYIASDLYVAGSVKDPLDTDLLPCFTVETKVLFPSEGSTVTGSPPHSLHPGRLVDNIADGIYDKDINTCYVADQRIDQPYALVQLPLLSRIKGVKVRTQNAGITAGRLNHVEVKVGTQLVGEDFTGFTQLATFKTELIEHNQDIVIEGKQAILGQFVAFIVKSGLLQICLIEVF